ncbi:cupredoxin domain-containing protein [Candidatus Hecatella orcuttiae]|uniref:cupredoxin domain-containing protein n=1 Tax=Candidatus Hecatella orcuttiae TaxID=1935119 RepID=UPI002867C580|nr:cupredoxin domain-containing protein [Candidatus Hecatella orcuttiae]
MNQTEWAALALLVAVLLVPSASIYGYDLWLDAQKLDEEVQVVWITGWAAENGGWSPSEITLRKGVPAKLIITSADVTHGFHVPDLGLDSGPIAPGHKAVIEFVPEETGTFTFRCSVFCSEGHQSMVGKITVVE